MKKDIILDLREVNLIRLMGVFGVKVNVCGVRCEQWCLFLHCVIQGNGFEQLNGLE